MAFYFDKVDNHTVASYIVECWGVAGYISPSGTLACKALTRYYLLTTYTFQCYVIFCNSVGRCMSTYGATCMLRAVITCSYGVGLVAMYNHREYRYMTGLFLYLDEHSNIVITFQT